jgi:uncharacterized repeat protein (TIGR01451 family)
MRRREANGTSVKIALFIAPVLAVFCLLLGSAGAEDADAGKNIKKRASGNGVSVRRGVRDGVAKLRRLSDIVGIADGHMPVRIASSSGAAAGTNITNKANGTYTAGEGDVISVDSNTVLDRIAEIIDVTVAWQGDSNIQASPGDAGRAAAFRVSNTGNGTEGFSLSANTAVAGDGFDPVLSGIYLDVNGNGTYDAGTDAVYVAGTNDPVLLPGGYLTVFVLCNIPAGLSDAATGDVRLAASSRTGTGTPGSLFAGMGDGGADAVVGLTGGAATGTARYEVHEAPEAPESSEVNVTVSIVKSAEVVDGDGGIRAVSGSKIIYTLSVTAVGYGRAVGVLLSDPMPANTAYVAGTLRLNGTALTDAQDADAGDVGGTVAGEVTVSLGDLDGGSPPQTITFEVTID